MPGNYFFPYAARDKRLTEKTGSGKQSETSSSACNKP
jgi:hypothetical protein